MTKRLEETIARLKTADCDIVPTHNVTVGNKSIRVLNSKELAVVEAVTELDIQYGTQSKSLHSALQWLIGQINKGNVPICPK